jgi:hypothetical protein
MIVAGLLAALIAPDADDAAGAGFPNGKPELAASAAGRLLQKKIKGKKGKRRKKRVQPFGGPLPCSGTSVITQTDEAGEPFFPFSIVPVTRESFFFSDQQPRLLNPLPSRLRVLLLDGSDPPMATVTEIGIGHLVLDLPGSGNLVGSSERRLVTCNVTLSTCTVLHDLGRPIFDVAAVGNGVFAVITTEDNGNRVVAILRPDGSETHVATRDDFPFTFPDTIAVHDGLVYFGGYRSVIWPTLTAVVMSVPVDGGFIRSVAELGTADGDHLFLRTLDETDRAYRHPQAMTFLGDDLIIASLALTEAMPGSGDIEPSHLLRVHIGIGGLADSVEEIPIDVDGFVNVIDLEALDGELFLVDIRSTTNGMPFSGQTGEPIFSGRLLRICP